MSMYQDWAAKYIIFPSSNFSSSAASITQRSQLQSGHETNINFLRKLGYEAYTIGWTAILKAELEASRLLLDEEHELLPPGEKDGNNYILGRMGLHNIVIAFPGPHADASAAELMENMLQTFRNIRFGLLVGVGGAAPGLPNLEDPRKDIRLGDVVVSDPNGAHGGLLQYDLDDWRANGEFHIKSTLNKPPGLLVKSVRLLRSDQSFGRGEMGRYIQRAIAIKKAIGQSLIDDCQYPGQDQDRLFEAGYQHVGGDDCSKCNAKMVERRLQRDTKEPEVHYKLIASAKKDLRRAEVRDKLHDVWDVACFESEATGFRDDFPCLVIRGICNYSDDHKNEGWQSYAAVVGAAYTKDLLRVVRPNDVVALPTALDILNAPPKPTLEDRIAELEQQVKKLQSELSDLANRPTPELPKEAHFESGSWTSPYLPSRDIEQRVTFSKSYTSVPRVTASISAADMDRHTNFRLNVSVKSVDLEGCSLRLYTWGDTKVYSAVVQWAAFGN
ncbi:hypothetical protein TWF751_007112 [Orbilia oligospora]|nr:hypothetical protein TWF751_007112 [Orbilia oligospora]